MVELLSFAAAGVFCVLAGTAVVQWRRRAHLAGRWLALMFGLLALISVIHVAPWAPAPGHPAHLPLRRGLLVVMVAMPYLQYRFVATFSGTHRHGHTFVGVLTAGLLAAALFLPGVAPVGEANGSAFAAVAAGGLLLWAGTGLMVAGRLWRAARAYGVAARQRMRTLAAGFALLACMVVLLGLTSSVDRSVFLRGSLGATSTTAGVVLAIGLAPPSAVRAFWRRREDEDGWLVKRGLVEATSAAEVAATCTAYASRLFGGRAALLTDGTTVLGADGLHAAEATSLAALLPAPGGDPAGPVDSGGKQTRLLAEPCGKGWLAVQADVFTPFFGAAEVHRLRSIAVLAELALDRVGLHEQVSRRNRQFVEAQALARVGSWEWDATGDHVSWSDELYRLHGLEPRDDGLRYTDVLATVHPSDRPAFERTVAAALDSGRPFAIEHRVVWPDGTVVLLHAVGKVLLGDDGRPVALVGACQDITERRRLEEEIAHQALHDPLTALANRTLFNERLGHALARRDRDALAVAVLFLDLDDFKAVNDELGHGAGDALLQAVGARLQELARSTDTVARLGGDEFGILLEEADLAAATILADRVRQALAQPLVVQGRELSTRASVGIVVDGTSTTVEEFLRNADAAMYAVKSGGKDGYRVFEDGMHDEAVKRLELRQDLEQALDCGELLLQYQPVVSLLDGTVSGAEALVRWQHPTRGLLGPGEFIRLAEESGLIVPLGDWVLRTAVSQLRAWQGTDEALAGFALHVNVSARQLREPDFVARVEAALDDGGVDPTCLTVEITESVLMGDCDTSVAALWGLRRLGVQVAIDDFGTGYSSLAYLQRLPIDTLKIDRAFVEGVLRGPEEEALAHAIVRIAATLRLSVVAEGVETAAQARRLVSLGCVTAQGYLYAPPLTPDDLLAYARAAGSPPAGAPRPLRSADGLRELAARGAHGRRVRAS